MIYELVWSKTPYLHSHFCITALWDSEQTDNGKSSEVKSKQGWNLKHRGHKSPNHIPPISIV